MRWCLAVAVMMVLAIGAGCTRLRFVVDAIPPDAKLTETVVLEDRPARVFGGATAKVALVDVTGLIADARRSELLSDGENPVDRFAESLRKAEADRRVKAVIVRLNSPGGAVTASDVMYREVQHFRKHTGRPVVMLMGDVAASGAYYLACAGDEIIAHPTSITGSIGVIMQTFNFSEGMRRIGIHADAITSGKNKAAGSPFEPMPPEHRALLQGIVDELYERFEAVVVEARPELTDENLQWITDGRIVTGRRAAEVGLIDRTGDLRDAFEAAKKLAKIPSAKLVKYHRPLDFVGSPYAQAPVVGGTEINLMQLRLDHAGLSDGVGFYYLWDPTVW